jgi:rifampicin phosphotransferase
MSFGHQQMMTDAMKPLGLSFFQAQFEETPLAEAGARFYLDLAPDLAPPLGRRIVLASMSRIEPLMGSALRGLMGRKGFVKGLARGGPRYFSLNGAGYLTWRLPVEWVRLYHANDPGVVPELMARHEAALDDLRLRLRRLSGNDVFEFVLHDLRHQLKTHITDSRSIAAIFVGLYALNWVTEYAKKRLDVTGAGDVLAQSVVNDVSSAMGLALLDVADTVRAHPDAMAALPSLADATFFRDLSAVPGGDVVGRAIVGFLDRYGMRCPGEIDITRTRWSEAPSTLVPLILSTIPNLEPNPRAARVERNRHEAEQLRTNLVERLAGLPGGRRKVRAFLRMSRRLQNYVGYREYPKYLMMRHYWIVKQALLREASALVDRGVLRRPDDVDYLTFDEFREAVRTGEASADLIARRREQFEAAARLTPPRIITSDGEVPSGTYGDGSAPAGALPGIAASAGTVEGRARIVRELTHADVAPGDILVTTFTDPGWTPIFLSVSGVVTEVGGAMTHGAVVAREYGLPAVVGVEHATRLIRDGQRIRVDGTAGYVQIL